MGIAAVTAAATGPFVEVEADWLVAALPLDWVAGRAVVLLVVRARWWGLARPEKVIVQSFRFTVSQLRGEVITNRQPDGEIARRKLTKPDF